MITLKTLPQATAREVFEQVRDHLLEQNKRADIHLPTGPVCVYRTEDGLKCAAGCLIGDDEYDAEEMECKGWSKLVSLEIVPPAHAQLIVDLQDIHDTAPVETWAHHLHLLGATLE